MRISMHELLGTAFKKAMIMKHLYYWTGDPEKWIVLHRGGLPTMPIHTALTCLHVFISTSSSRTSFFCKNVLKIITLFPT